jgi:hypothetical protein
MKSGNSVLISGNSVLIVKNATNLSKNFYYYIILIIYINYFLLIFKDINPALGIWVGFFKQPALPGKAPQKKILHPDQK